MHTDKDVTATVGSSSLLWTPTQEWTAILTPILGVVHFFSSAWISHYSFGLVGGVETNGFVTQYGGIEYAWTNLTWLPGGLFFLIGEGFYLIGLILLVAGSGTAGFVAAGTLARFMTGTRQWFGRRGWRLWLLVGTTFGWVPVPAAATLTHLMTVVV